MSELSDVPDLPRGSDVSDRSPDGLTYKAAGVDIEAGDELVERIRAPVKRTLRPEVIGGLGGFGALCPAPVRISLARLVSGTDGVGTKLKLAIEHDAHDTVGIDLVAMCVNDVVVQAPSLCFFSTTSLRRGSMSTSRRA